MEMYFPKFGFVQWFNSQYPPEVSYVEVNSWRFIWKLVNPYTAFCPLLSLSSFSSFCWSFSCFCWSSYISNRRFSLSIIPNASLLPNRLFSLLKMETQLHGVRLWVLIDRVIRERSITNSSTQPNCSRRKDSVCSGAALDQLWNGITEARWKLWYICSSSNDWLVCCSYGRSSSHPIGVLSLCFVSAKLAILSMLCYLGD